MDHQQTVLKCYQAKEYMKVLNLIEECPIQLIRNSFPYKILKATCFVNLGIEIETAHSILDEVLENSCNNEFAHYCKGLVFFHEKIFGKAAACFEKAIELDTLGTMQKAKEMRIKALDLMKEGEEEQKVKIQESDQKQNNSDILNKTCKICQKTFTKRHGLKRHMKRVHSEEKMKIIKCHIE